MRGHLRIRSRRAGYRRAGLVFGQDRDVEIPATDISPDQLATLACDPVLSISVFVGDRYLPLADFVPPPTDGLVVLTAGAAGQLLAELRTQAEAGESEAAAPAGDDAALKLATALSELDAANSRAARLRDELQRSNDRIAALEAQLAASNAAGSGGPAPAGDNTPAGAKTDEGGAKAEEAQLAASTAAGSGGPAPAGDETPAGARTDEGGARAEEARARPDAGGTAPPPAARKKAKG